MSEPVELKLYSPLHVDVIDLDYEPKNPPDKDSPVVPLEAVGRYALAAYTEWILNAIQKLQSQTDAQNAFTYYAKRWNGIVSEKVISISQSVEKVRGRLYGVAVCQSKEPLDPEEVQSLKSYCQNQYDMGLQDGYAHCPRGAPYKGLYFHYWQGGSDRLLTRAELDAALEAGRVSSQAVVLEVNKDTFWTLIHEAKRLWGQDLEGSAQWLEDQLLMMGPKQAQNFDKIITGYSSLAYKYGLWTAASIMLDGCSDDGFIDFRNWLIAQGRDVYLAALKDPDSLADVPVYGGGNFESLSSVGSMAYEKLTDEDLDGSFDRTAYKKLESELAKGIEYGEGIDYPYKWSETADYLPRLCEKYLTPEGLAMMIRYHNDTWNPTSPEVQCARETAVKGKKVKRKGGDVR